MSPEYRISAVVSRSANLRMTSVKADLPELQETHHGKFLILCWPNIGVGLGQMADAMHRGTSMVARLASLCLLTRDAHRLYEQCGSRSLNALEMWMESDNPEIYVAAHAPEDPA